MEEYELNETELIESTTIFEIGGMPRSGANMSVSPRLIETSKMESKQKRHGGDNSVEQLL